MDTKKLGALLKELRKERGYTQQQLAEQLNVSARTVSRWETGVNLPDLDVLLILADFYDIEIREMLEGEHKNKTNLQGDSMKRIAEYSTWKERIFIRRLIWVVVLGVVSWCVSLGIMLLFLNEVRGGALILFFTLLCFILYCLGTLPVKANRTASGLLLTFIGAFSSVTVSNLALFSVFFGTGNYHNYGVVGVWYTGGICGAVFLAAGILVNLANRGCTGIVVHKADPTITPPAL